ncbi:hypothetical protein DVH05_009763 [Phytophthora capsici]|nr:hypothetical protein DVH05_009763 [Phytophthora capsici]
MSAHGSSGSTAVAARAVADPAATAPEGESAALAALREENARLIRMLDSRNNLQGVPTSSARTAPNARGEMPPPAVCDLSYASFPEEPKKAKGEYNPPQAHLLAGGRMLKNFPSKEGKPLSAMSFVL